MRDGEFVENGTFEELMAIEDGTLKKLIREHVEKEQNKLKNDDEILNKNFSIRNVIPSLNSENNLTDLEMIERLKKAGVSESALEEASEAIIAARLEGNHPFQLVTDNPALKRKISIMSKISNHDIDPVPEDSEPMKLVLEDQSIYYKEKPIWSYLKAGAGVIISLIIFAYFFAVHVVRITSGKMS